MKHLAAAIAVLILAASCGSSAEIAGVSAGSLPTPVEVAVTEAPAAPALSDVPTSVEQPQLPADTGSTDAGSTAGAPSTFTAEVWADNWFAFYVDGVLIALDSVSIDTERSFNAETFTFEAAYPFTMSFEAKDFKETDSGIEYIGQNNQQMGDGGLIAQITDTSTGAVIATDASWSSLVIHRAPLNKECEKDPDPDTTCQFESVEEPIGWVEAGFDDSAWTPATEWDEGAVRPKDGYDQITWSPSAKLVWGGDLEVDNTVLFRLTVG